MIINNYLKLLQDLKELGMEELSINEKIDLKDALQSQIRVFYLQHDETINGRIMEMDIKFVRPKYDRHYAIRSYSCAIKKSDGFIGPYGIKVHYEDPWYAKGMLENNLTKNDLYTLLTGNVIYKKRNGQGFWLQLDPTRRNQDLSLMELPKLSYIKSDELYSRNWVLKELPESSYNIADVLQKYSFREVLSDPVTKDAIIDKIKKGSEVSLTLLKDEKEVAVVVKANPWMGNLAFYDIKGTKINFAQSIF